MIRWLAPLEPVVRRLAVNRASAERKSRWLRNPANRAAYNAKRRQKRTQANQETENGKEVRT